MKKTLLTVALALLASAATTICAYAQGNPEVFSGTITLTNTVTTGSDSFSLCEPGILQREIVKIELDHQTGTGTGTVTVALVNLGGASETVDVSDALAEAGTYNEYPVLTTTVTDTDFVVTGNVVVAVSPVRTVDVGRYSGRGVLVSVDQPSNTSTNTYKYSIFAR